MNFITKYFKRRPIDPPPPPQKQPPAEITIQNFKFMHQDEEVQPRIKLNYTLLKKSLPEHYRGVLSWSLVYSTYKHGHSLKTMYMYTQSYTKPFILVVRDARGDVFGAFVDEKIEIRQDLFGKMSTFLFKVKRYLDGDEIDLKKKNCKSEAEQSERKDTKNEYLGVDKDAVDEKDSNREIDSKGDLNKNLSVKPDLGENENNFKVIGKTNNCNKEIDEKGNKKVFMDKNDIADKSYQNDKEQNKLNKEYEEIQASSQIKSENTGDNMIPLETNHKKNGGLNNDQNFNKISAIPENEDDISKKPHREYKNLQEHVNKLNIEKEVFEKVILDENNNKGKSKSRKGNGRNKIVENGNLLNTNNYNQNKNSQAEKIKEGKNRKGDLKNIDLKVIENEIKPESKLKGGFKFRKYFTFGRSKNKNSGELEEIDFSKNQVKTQQNEKPQSVENNKDQKEAKTDLTLKDANQQRNELFIYKATGKNHYFCHCNSKFIAFGCSGGYFGLLLNSDMTKGESHVTETFSNEVLSSSSKFYLSEVEIWTIDY